VSANIYCWTREARLDPDNGSLFAKQLDALHDGPTPEPSSALIAFVDDLLARYPDLDELDDDKLDDNVWSDGPLTGNIIGEFINIGILWSRYDVAALFVIEMAKKHQLFCYDPQSENLYCRP
jgi:hypothetical protein